MANKPNPFESKIWNEARIELNSKEIKNAISLLKDHGYVIQNSDGKYIKKGSNIKY